MSRDQYYDNHMIAVHQGKSLKLDAKNIVAGSEDCSTIYFEAVDFDFLASNRISFTAEGGSINLFADDQDSDVFMKAGQDIKLEADGNISLTSAEDMDIDSSDNMNLVSLSSITASAPYISIKTSGEGSPFVGMVLGSSNGRLLIQGGEDVICQAVTDVGLQAQTGDITLTTAVGDVRVTSSNDITIDSGNSVIIEAENDFNVDAADEINLTSLDAVTIDASNFVVKTDTGLNGDVQITGIVDINSAATSASQCTIDVSLSSYAVNDNAYWMKFTSNTGFLKGAVQYAPSTSGVDSIPEGYGYSFKAFLADGTTQAATGLSNDLMFSPAGSARFVSGAADFGEYFEAGNYSEWPEATGDDSNTLGIPEGLTVWVREGKFYREMISEKCIPMLVTKRSIVTGDASEILKEESSSKGAILSFCGKLPVLIEGTAEAGDYVVPVNNHNHCIAVNFEDISFSQYKKAVGRVLYSSKGHEEEDVSFSLIMCAVGIK